MVSVVMDGLGVASRSGSKGESLLESVGDSEGLGSTADGAARLGSTCEGEGAAVADGFSLGTAAESAATLDVKVLQPVAASIANSGIASFAPANIDSVSHDPRRFPASYLTNASTVAVAGKCVLVDLRLEGSRRSWNELVAA